MVSACARSMSARLFAVSVTLVGCVPTAAAQAVKTMHQTARSVTYVMVPGK